MDKGRSDSPDNHALSRRDYWKWTFGVGAAVAYGKLVGEATRKLSRGISYPIEHEHQVESTITRTLVEAANSLRNRNARMLRVLEVGIGPDCRTVRQGLYNNALEHLPSMGVSGVELTGVDLKVPSSKVLDEARGVLSHAIDGQSFSVDLHTDCADITGKLAYPDGHFDALVCCLTLCSVADQQATLRELRRLLRPNGGTFGYVEHVAVDRQEPYHFLEWQQETFDPLQQLVADNCHLHRYTDENIASTFGVDSIKPDSVRLQHERFLVDDMWPVSCQTCGVIQRLS